MEFPILVKPPRIGEKYYKLLKKSKFKIFLSNISFVNYRIAFELKNLALDRDEIIFGQWEQLRLLLNN